LLFVIFGGPPLGNLACEGGRHDCVHGKMKRWQ
jgi:hypothetical protein